VHSEQIEPAACCSDTGVVTQRANMRENKRCTPLLLDVASVVGSTPIQPIQYSVTIVVKTQTVLNILIYSVHTGENSNRAFADFWTVFHISDSSVFISFNNLLSGSAQVQEET